MEPDLSWSRRRILTAFVLACSVRPLVAEKESKPAGEMPLNAGELAKLLPAWRPESSSALLALLEDRSLRGRIPAPKVESILGLERKSIDDLMSDLLPVAQLYSRPPISQYRVGAIAEGRRGVHATDVLRDAAPRVNS